MSPPKRPNSHYQQLDTAVRVETPERIAFQYQVVGPFRRLMAYGLDIGIVGLAFIGCCVAILLTFLLVSWVVPQISGDFFGQLLVSSFGVIAIIAALAFWFYGAVCETVRNGQTFGKQIANIRVLSTDGSAIDGVQAMVRNLFRFLDIMPFMPATLFFVFDIFEDAYPLPLFLAGLTCMVFSKKFQRIGDLVAGTMVVLVERDWAPELASFSDPRVAKLAEMIPNDFVVSPSMSKALAAFVETTPRLGPDHSSEIAARMANPLKEKFGFPGDIDATLLLCALYFKTFSRFNSEEDPLSVGTLATSTQPRTNPTTWPGTELPVDQDSSSPVVASPIEDVDDYDGDLPDLPDRLPTGDQE
jgi:uncharacterized RDD family membrane protein YckC